MSRPNASSMPSRQRVCISEFHWRVFCAASAGNDSSVRMSTTKRHHSEAQAQAELQGATLSAVGGRELVGHDAERARRIDIGGGIGRHEVVQDVHELEGQG